MPIDTSTEVKATARYIRMSPFKVRRVLDQIRGISYREALILSLIHISEPTRR